MIPTATVMEMTFAPNGNETKRRSGKTTTTHPLFASLLKTNEGNLTAQDKMSLIQRFMEDENVDMNTLLTALAAQGIPTSGVDVEDFIHDGLQIEHMMHAIHVAEWMEMAEMFMNDQGDSDLFGKLLAALENIDNIGYEEEKSILESLLHVLEEWSAFFDQQSMDNEDVQVIMAQLHALQNMLENWQEDLVNRNEEIHEELLLDLLDEMAMFFSFTENWTQNHRSSLFGSGFQSALMDETTYQGLQVNSLVQRMKERLESLRTNISSERLEERLHQLVQRLDAQRTGRENGLSNGNDSLRSGSLIAVAGEAERRATGNTGNRGQAVVRMQHMIQDFAEQFRNQVRISPQGGSNQLRIQLVPEHLGHLDMRIQTLNGKIQAQIFTSSRMAQETIELQLGQLRTALQQQGIQVERIDVSQQPLSHFSGNQQEGQSTEHFFEQRQERQKYAHTYRSEEDLVDDEALYTGEDRPTINYAI